MHNPLVYELVRQLYSGNRIPELAYLQDNPGAVDIFSNIDDIRHIDIYAAMGRVVSDYLNLSLDVNMGGPFEITVEATEDGIILSMGIDCNGDMEGFEIDIIDDILSELGYF